MKFKYRLKLSLKLPEATGVGRFSAVLQESLKSFGIVQIQDSVQNIDVAANRELSTDETHQLMQVVEAVLQEAIPHAKCHCQSIEYFTGDGDSSGKPAAEKE